LDPETSTFVNCETELFSVNPQKIENTANFICRSLGFEKWELSISFVDSEEIRRLNQEFRSIDKSTDVLSFPQQEWDEPVTLEHPFKQPKNKSPIPFMLGDLVISLNDANSNAREIGHGLDRETVFLLVHGILHLCGHDHIDPEDEEIMTSQQRKLMEKISSAGQLPLWEQAVSPNQTIGSNA
jgi:probable rRNA maturation factor